MIATGLLALLLGGVFMATLASDDPKDLLLGVGLAGVVLLALRGRLELAPRGHDRSLASKILWFPVFAGAVLADVVLGTKEVALRVVHLRELRSPGIVRIPVGERSERGVAVSALATTLSPGTVLVDIDHERQEMLVHVIDASDPDAVRAQLQRFYDRYQRRVFP